MRRSSRSHGNPASFARALARTGPTLAVLLLLSACGDHSPTGPGGTVPLGDWGGVDIALTVTASGGTLQRLCASGTISRPMTLDGTGRFDAPGIYVVTAGPSVMHPARYTGTTDGHTMTLTIVQTDNGQTVGIFTLTYGQVTNIRPCPIV